MADSETDEDDESAPLLDRCVYTILLSRQLPKDIPLEETPFARVDTRLISSKGALFAIATLPVLLRELESLEN